jgi:hypothetical protein
MKTQGFYSTGITRHEPPAATRRSMAVSASAFQIPSGPMPCKGPKERDGTTSSYGGGAGVVRLYGPDRRHEPPKSAPGQR